MSLKPKVPANVFGAPLPPAPDDLETMMAVEAPVEDFEPFDSNVAGESAANFGAEWSSPEAVRAGKNTVLKIGPPLRTLYDAKGESRGVMHSDVPFLVGTDIPPHNRLYIRCPRCVEMPNRGLHPFSGPNGCPGKPKRKWSACPICRSHGIEHRVFEDEAFPEAPDMEIDENYVAPRLPNERERDDRLRRKLDQHMTAFHAGEADELFGIRRRQVNEGRSFVIESN